VRLAPIDAAADGSSRLDHIYPTMPATSQAQLPAEPQPPRKKRRSREPDWKTFYKNGLPKEIIVIDDTPEPDRPNAATAAAQTLANGRQHAAPNGAANSSAKKRKRDDEPTPYDPVHHSAAIGSHTPSKSTAASDRTNSAIHTTAATSLGSLSSNGHYEYDTQPGQKRKRTTRQQIANEARRREAAIYTDALAHYRPPPHPPKKARDVHIKVVPDVSGPVLLSLYKPLTNNSAPSFQEYPRRRRRWPLHCGPRQ
jgi:dual-specificity kinase